MKHLRDFIDSQFQGAYIFYSGKNRWRRMISVIFLGVIYNQLFGYFLAIFGITNSIFRHIILGISWFLLSYLLINLFLKVFFNRRITKMSYTNLLFVSIFLFSSKTQKDTFEPIISDWQEEYFEALFKKQIWKARWINVRYTYAFILAMWQKSPIGDLIELVRKIAS